MTIHTPESIRRTGRQLDRKSRRGEDLRERVEIALNIMHEGCFALPLRSTLGSVVGAVAG
jgi:hypothetical protein